jgi:hypothetical protein
MSENIEKTFSVASPARLSVSNIRGSVEIHPGELTVDEALGQLHA